MKKIIALFDFDGVVVDTESQYTEFWNKVGKECLGLENFGHTIKGQTLKQISAKHFDGKEEMLDKVVPELDAFERTMSYEYIPGAFEMMKALKEAGMPIAIVTSSNDIKMAQAYKAHPELLDMVDAVLTSEWFTNSKPDPECFIKGMEHLGGTPENTIVFEDSFHGITAGRASGAFVVGLATTNKREDIAPRCDHVIDDFTGLTVSQLLELLAR